MPDGTLASVTAASAAALVAGKHVSPLELTQAALSAIEAREPSVGAFAALDGERAVREARCLSDELAVNGPRSPLHGIPVGVKDLIDVAGLPTSAGSAVLAGMAQAHADAPVVAALRRAGAVIIGKTKTHEFAFGAVTPDVRHPGHPDRIVGGSSGGSAAAVAAGEVLVALGTDTGGSLRVPSAFCGTVGLKPRHGRLPMSGIIPLSPLLDCVGPITRTSEDARLVWQVLRPGRPVPASPPDGHLRVGIVAAEALGPLDHQVADAFTACMTALGRRPDVSVEEVRVPGFGEWAPSRSVPLLADALQVHSARGWYPRLRDKYGTAMRAALDRAHGLSAPDLAVALRTVRALADAVDEVLASCDVLALPTVAVLAPRREDILRGPEADRDGRALLSLCAPFNWCSAAAASVPCGYSAEGIPVGLQLAGRTEDRVLTAASRVEQLRLCSGPS